MDNECQPKTSGYGSTSFMPGLVKPSQVEAVLPELGAEKLERIKPRLERCTQATTH